jgi:hypothetical protein
MFKKCYLLELSKPVSQDAQFSAKGISSTRSSTLYSGGFVQNGKSWHSSKDRNTYNTGWLDSINKLTCVCPIFTLVHGCSLYWLFFDPPWKRIYLSNVKYITFTSLFILTFYYFNICNVHSWFCGSLTLRGMNLWIVWDSDIFNLITNSIFCSLAPYRGAGSNLTLNLNQSILHK